MRRPRKAPAEDRERSRAYTERPRRIPPELARDFQLEGRCSILAALALVRVIAAADDQGRLQGDHRYIRSVAFGMRDGITVRKVGAALEELHVAGFIQRYAVDDMPLIQVLNWWPMQGSWGRRAYPSRYSPPPGWTDNVFGTGPSSEQPVSSSSAPSEQTAPPSPNTSPSPNTYTVRGRGSSAAPSRSAALNGRAATPLPMNGDGSRLAADIAELEGILDRPGLTPLKREQAAQLLESKLREVLNLVNDEGLRGPVHAALAATAKDAQQRLHEMAGTK